MPAKPTQSFQAFASIAVAIALLSALRTASAGTVEWNGGSGSSPNWSDSLNWLGLNRPNNDGADTVKFRGSPARKTSTVNQGYWIDTIEFNKDGLFGTSSSFTINGPGWLKLKVVDNRLTQAQTINAPIELAAQAGFGNTTTDDGADAGKLTLGNVYLAGHMLLLNSNDNGMEITGVISGGETGSGVTVTSGKVTLSGANTFFGDVVLFNSGELRYASGPNLGSLGNRIVVEGEQTRLVRTTSGTTVTPFYFESGAVEIDAAAGLNITYSGDVSINPQSLYATLRKTGSGTVTLTGANTASRLITEVDAGTLRIEGAALLGDAPLFINAGATLTYTAGKVDTVGTLNGSGNLNVGANGGLQVGNDDATASIGYLANGAGSFSGLLQGANATFIKSGRETLVITGQLNTTGAATVRQGTLVIDGSGTPSSITVNARAKLAGDGSLTNSSVFVSGMLAPSNVATPDYGSGILGIGPLTFSGPEGTLEIDLTASGIDRITVNGAADLTHGRLRLATLDTGGPSLTTPWAILMTKAGYGATRFAEVTGRRVSDTTWLAIIYAGNNVYVAKAAAGDATLDGAVNFDDLLLLASRYNTADGSTWQSGDFTGDGAVNFDDLLQLAANYNTSTPLGDLGGAWALAQASVPEPAAIVASSIISVAALRRTRRRRID